MPKNPPPKTHSDASDAAVKLKQILGMRPGVYLTVIYAAALALIVFFLLFYPGIRNPGAYLTVSVQPGSASVLVDGVFAGTAPGTVFIRNGERRIQAAKPYYKSAETSLRVRGRVFATLFVRSRMHASFTLEVEDLQGLLGHALADFAVNPHIPQIVSDAAWAAYGIRRAGRAAADQARIMDFLVSAAARMTTETQLRELIAGSSRAASFGTFLTPQSFLALARRSAALAQTRSNSPAWLLLSLSRERARKLSASPWITAHFTAYRDGLSRYYSTSPGAASGGGGAAVLGGIRFRSIPAGVAVLGRDDNLEALGKSIDALLPHPVTVGAFLLSETEVTNRQFRLFLEENPLWKPAARASLIAKGMVTESYLQDWKDDGYPAGQDEMPVSSVSYNAAAAYCGWLTTRLQSAVPGLGVRLPTEAEWEWAARGGLRGMPYPMGEKPGRAVLFTKGITGPSPVRSSEPNGYGLRDMVGNVWEWCSDCYGSSDYLLSSQDPQVNAELIRGHDQAGDRVVRGGAWNSQRELLKVYTRGSQPADWCTPYLGFRVAIGRP
jgi:gamma-glutamyl hercynylcysteine S-oxide synthase